MPNPDATRSAVTGGDPTPTVPAAGLPSTIDPPTVVAPDPRLPSVPGYDVLGELGRGGMGVVYRARQVALNRAAALKMVLGEARAESKGLIRFLVEAEAAAAIDHPHVVRVFEYGDAGGSPFLALEYLPGGTLADRLKGGRLTPREAAGLVGKIARGVQAAHDRQIVHRDLKPGNVLFDAAGEPKVADFGLAKTRGENNLTATRAVMGTPAYMAPEQAAGGSKFVGPQADVWALGVILYESLTGTRPFATDNPWAVMQLARSADPAPVRSAAPGVPRDLDLVCRKCLAKDPRDRYPTAKELADDLDRFAAGYPVTARSIDPATQAYRWVRRNPVVAGLAAAAVLFLAVGGAASAVLAHRANRAAAAERSAAAERDEAVRRQKQLVHEFLWFLVERNNLTLDQRRAITREFLIDHPGYDAREFEAALAPASPVVPPGSRQLDLGAARGTGSGGSVLPFVNGD